MNEIDIVLFDGERISFTTEVAVNNYKGTIVATNQRIIFKGKYNDDYYGFNINLYEIILLEPVSIGNENNEENCALIQTENNIYKIFVYNPRGFIYKINFLLKLHT